MHAPLFLAICALFLMGAADAVSRRARQLDVPVGTYLLVQTPFFMITAIAASLLFCGFDFSVAAWGYAAVSAALAFSATVLLVKSLKFGKASVNVVIFRLSFVFSTAAALFMFEETLSPAKVLGLATAGLAIALFALDIQGSVERESLCHAVAAMVLAAGLQLVWACAAKARVQPASFLLAQSLSFTVPAAIYAYYGRRDGANHRALKYAPINGVLTASGTLAALAAMDKGEVSTTIPIVQLSFVVTVFLSVLFLRERVTLPKVAAGLLAVIAVVMLGVK